MATLYYSGAMLTLRTLLPVFVLSLACASAEAPVPAPPAPAAPSEAYKPETPAPPPPSQVVRYAGVALLEATTTEVGRG